MVPKHGQEELRHVQGQGRRLGGATLYRRSGAVAALYWSSLEEIPYVKGKRNPSKTVGAERGHQRADRLNYHMIQKLHSWR